MSVIWKDGHFLDGTRPQVFHNDVGFSNGLGVFDSMLAQDGVFVEAKAHYERLVHDAQVVLGINDTWFPSLSGISEVWMPLLVQNKLSKGFARVKTIVTGGVSDRPLSLSRVPSVLITVSKSGDPRNLPLLKCAVVRNHPRIAGSVLENCKRLDYSRSLATRQDALAVGADEAIITNTEGHVVCGSTSNLFIEENGVLVTPPLSDGVLAGVTRANVIKFKQAREESITEERLRAAQKVFLTNSFWGMREVSLVN